MRTVTRPMLICIAILSCLGAYLGDRIAALHGAASGIWIEKLLTALDGLAGDIAARPMWLSLSSTALMAGLTGAVAVWLIWLYWLTAEKHYMPGEEHGKSENG